VEGRHLFGVRAGIGVGVPFEAEGQTVSRHLDGTGAWDQTWDVRDIVDPRLSVGLPVLLVLYIPPGRDVYGYDHRFTWNFGFTMGLDAVAPHMRWYPIGLLLDVGGFGLGVSLMLERISVTHAPTTTSIVDPRPADQRSTLLPLDTVVSASDQVSAGIAISITVDFDLFQRLVMFAVDDTHLGRLGTGASAGSSASSSSD
jgi:hypothetical protein